MVQRERQRQTLKEEGAAETDRESERVKIESDHRRRIQLMHSDIMGETWKDRGNWTL